MSAARENSEVRLLVPSLMFIALVVSAVASLGAPLITSVATTFHVSLDNHDLASGLTGAFTVKDLASLAILTVFPPPAVCTLTPANTRQSSN